MTSSYEKIPDKILLDIHADGIFDGALVANDTGSNI